MSQPKGEPLAEEARLGCRIPRPKAGSMQSMCLCFGVSCHPLLCLCYSGHLGGSPWRRAQDEASALGSEGPPGCPSRTALLFFQPHRDHRFILSLGPKSKESGKKTRRARVLPIYFSVTVDVQYLSFRGTA